ncbi:MAG: glycosyltransferase [Planctomycetes bacterium]|nr:glycosyltransferase [Planctomycetota bacterium]
MPRVSVGMPVHNGERFIRPAIESLLSQDFTDFELIISDNASTDGTQEICSEFAQRDARIRYLRTSQNLGAAANFNRVFELATGEFFKWATHDDVCACSNLRRCLEVFDRSPPEVVLCYGKTVLIDEKGQVIRPYEDRMDLRQASPHRRLEHVLRYLFLCHVDMGLIRRRILATTRLHAPYRGSDTVLVAELALRGKFYEIPEPLFFRRLHSGNSMQAHRTAEAHALWFDPTWRGQVAVPRFQRLLGHFRAICDAPLDWSERLNCMRVLLRHRLIRNQEWRHLGNELHSGLRKKLKLLLARQSQRGSRTNTAARARVDGVP